MLGHHGLLTIFGWRLVLGGLLGTRAGAAPSGPFELYAYGGGISGAQVFYSNGMAFVGNQTQMDDEEAASVVFTTGPNNAFVGNPDMKSSRGIPTWSNKAFFIPSATSLSHNVGFTSKTSEPDTDADMDTSGFIFYGATALHLNADNTLHGLWYVLPTPSSRVWSLHWNATGDKSDGHLSVTLRNVAPVQPI
ncbi:hypothetical protein F5Y09DRAFT_310287 [Xylaria sp. FL1042]|nr:hypothetical protein F5Y09DRAFT_310287 [Xylaria sp. FL1042]